MSYQNGTGTEEETIAAISTAMGEGGIGLVRVSGGKSIDIIRRIFAISGEGEGEQKSFTLRRGYIFEPKTKERIDEVLVSIMKAPKTYTREDVVEINCHGGIAAQRKILQLEIEQGQ